MALLPYRPPKPARPRLSRTGTAGAMRPVNYTYSRRTIGGGTVGPSSRKAVPDRGIGFAGGGSPGGQPGGGIAGVGTALGQPEQMPWDTNYEQRVGLINRQRNDALAGLTHQQSQLGSAYGYGVDASGNVSVDPSNPFSKAALLKQSYDRNRAQSTNSYAAQGQLYSGALQNAQNFNANQYTQGEDTLKRDFQSQVAELLRRRKEVEQGAEESILGAGDDRLERAIAAAQQNSVDPGEDSKLQAATLAQKASTYGTVRKTGKRVTPDRSLKLLKQVSRRRRRR